MKLILETPRLQLRVLTLDDAGMILTLLNEASFIKNIGDKNVRDQQGAENYIQQGPLAMQDEFGYSFYGCVRKSDGYLLGISGLIKRTGMKYPEVGFAFLNQYCRQGYGFESASAVISYAEEKLSIKHLQAICNIDNKASQGLLARLGFSYSKIIDLDYSGQTVMLFDRIKIAPEVLNVNS